MKTLTKLLLGMALMAGASSQAADYAVQKTFWSFNGTWTNSTTIVTNLNAVIDLTQFSDWALQIVAKGTNNTGGAGSFDINWETSLDGSNFASITNAGGGGLLRTSGWFAAPVQSNVTTTVWITNITADAIGYWRLRSVTNNTGMNYTNLTISGYVKPKRTNRDF